MRILIVEDEARIADFLDRGLRAEGHFCVIAVDGEEGLSLALDGDFDLILLDLVLPKMHGHEVCQQLRMNKVNTPLMILTAMDSIEADACVASRAASIWGVRNFIFSIAKAFSVANVPSIAATVSADFTISIGMTAPESPSFRNACAYSVAVRASCA